MHINNYITLYYYEKKQCLELSYICQGKGICSSGKLGRGFVSRNDSMNSRAKIFPRERVSKIPASTEIRVVIGCCSLLNFHAQITTNQRHYTNLSRTRHQNGISLTNLRGSSSGGRIEGAKCNVCLLRNLDFHIPPLVCITRIVNFTQ